MNDYVILADSTCDLNSSLRERFGLKDFIPFHVVTPDNVDHLGDMDFLMMSKEEFYKQLENKKNVFTTSPPNVNEFIDFFEYYLSKNIDVIYLTLSSKLSGCYNFALMAKNELINKYPNSRLTIVDTKRYSIAVGLLIISGLQLQKEGKTYDEVLDFYKKNTNRVHETGPMDDLFFLSRKGRVSFGAAFMGTLVGVKPIGDFNQNGMTTVLTKEVGIKQAMKTSIEYVKRTIENPRDQIIFVADTDRERNAELLKSLLEKEIQPKEVIRITCNPSTACNTGPGLAACYYYGKEISNNLVEETKLMKEIASKK